ncbi:MAG: hypothetical protein JO107_14170, partial [Hyphomicrobiales bacterium]|nr:hypothetical protein [Hyphomicrobiales bacterium]MBV8664235.1 hypothetical protein [Hyphomicrobiales bacterium]
AEFRLVDGSYAGGYKRFYLKPGDWLLRGAGADVRVVSDDEFNQIQLGHKAA